MTEENIKKFLQEVGNAPFRKTDLRDLVAMACPRAAIYKVRGQENVFEIHVDPAYIPAIEFLRTQLPLTLLAKTCVLNPLSNFSGYVWLE